MTTQRAAICYGVGLPSGNAEANRKQGPRVAGMRPTVRADGRRHRKPQNNHLPVKEAVIA